MADRQLFHEVKNLMERAETCRASNYFAPARNLVREAQGKWSPTLGIPRPDFSNEVWRELDTREMEQMSAFTDGNAVYGEDGATAALEAARTIWERLAELRLPRPELSQVSQRRLQTGRRVTWEPSHLSTAEGEKYFCPICIQDRNEDSYKHDYCKKTFCIECLNKWTEYSRSCPICRQDM
jgi:hypothetical protein